MSKFTPGPWKVRASPHGNHYRCVQIGKDENYTTLEMEPADARLIASAPAMYAELRDILDWALTEKAPLRAQEIEHIRSVLKAATGE